MARNYAECRPAAQIASVMHEDETGMVALVILAVVVFGVLMFVLRRYMLR